MPGLEPEALYEKWRQEDDKQGPQIIDEVHLERRREAEGREKKGVVAENAAHADREGRKRDAPLFRLHEPDEAPDHESDSYRKEGRKGVYPRVE